jgi:hypothetical protein
MQVYRVQGSSEAQASENYNAIISSLEGTYDAEYVNAKARM